MFLSVCLGCIYRYGVVWTEDVWEDDGYTLVTWWIRKWLGRSVVLS